MATFGLGSQINVLTVNATPGAGGIIYTCPAGRVAYVVGIHGNAVQVDVYKLAGDGNSPGSYFVQLAASLNYVAGKNYSFNEYTSNVPADSSTLTTNDLIVLHPGEQLRAGTGGKAYQFTIIERF